MHNRIFNVITPTKKRLPPIPYLIELTLKVIYDKKNASDRDKSDVEDFILRYNETILRAKDELRDKFGAGYIDNDLRPVGTKGTVIDETEFWIMWCAQRLVQDERHIGEVARNKRDILEFGLDYRKMYQLPGSVSLKDRMKALKALKAAIAEHPEEYT